MKNTSILNSVVKVNGMRESLEARKRINCMSQRVKRYAELTGSPVDDIPEEIVNMLQYERPGVITAFIRIMVGASLGDSGCSRFVGCVEDICRKAVGEEK